MAAVDYEILCYQRLKAILLAHAPLTALVGRWVWYDGNAADPEAVGVSASTAQRDRRTIPSDFPSVALEPSGYSQEHWEARPRYGDHNVNATAASLNRKTVVTFNFLVRITHRDLRLTLNSPVEAEVMRALRGSNPTLNIPGGAAGYEWVRDWGPLIVSRQMGQVEGDASGLARMQSLFPIPVRTVFNSADLLT
jgi:hypothetical protein